MNRRIHGKTSRFQRLLSDNSDRTRKTPRGLSILSSKSSARRWLKPNKTNILDHPLFIFSHTYWLDRPFPSDLSCESRHATSLSNICFSRDLHSYNRGNPEPIKSICINWVIQKKSQSRLSSSALIREKLCPFCRTAAVIFCFNRKISLRSVGSVRNFLNCFSISSRT